MVPAQIKFLNTHKRKQPGVLAELLFCKLSILLDHPRLRNNQTGQGEPSLDAQSLLCAFPGDRQHNRSAYKPVHCLLTPSTLFQFCLLQPLTVDSIMVLQLQQKASEVDSSRVPSAIQNLINSWKASDSESDRDSATSSSGSQAPNDSNREAIDTAEPSGRVSGSNGFLRPDTPGEDEQQQEKRNRLLSLFSRGRNGQQQPEELMPLRVSLCNQHSCQKLQRQPSALYFAPYISSEAACWTLMLVLPNLPQMIYKQKAACSGLC